MTRRNVQLVGRTVWIADDDALPSDLGWWAVLRTRVIDEITEAPPHARPRLRSDTPRCVPRVSDEAVCGLVARPRDVSAALTTPGALRATIEVDGYLPQVLDAAIDAARRRLPGGAAIGATLLTIAPAETPGRPQFRPGRGVMVQRAAATEPEHFSLEGDPVAPPAANEVPMIDALAVARAPNTFVAGVPIVLPDQRLHRAEPARIRGRALRQVAAGSSPVPAPAAHIGLRGVWWTQAEVAAASVPPHPVRFVAFAAPLAFAHAVGATLERITLVPDGIGRSLQATAAAAATTLQLHPWNALQPAGGDVLQIEADNSAERELVISDGFDATIDAARPATLRLRTPLAFAHARDALVVGAAPIAAALGTAERDAVSGDRVLFASTLAGVTTTDLLRIGGVAADAELRFVHCVPTHDGVVFTHEVPLAADGTFELPPVARIAQVQFFVEHAGHPPQLPFEFAPEPGDHNVLQVLFTP